ncbi:hypothetical protein ACWCP6_31220 [Streptomyces sp. NPDC002004]
MARDGFRPAYHPAGHDAGLRAALQDLRAGRWVSMRNLLEETLRTGGSGAPGASGAALWTQRTQILAAAAAGTDLVQTWWAEEPGSVTAGVMHARVTVERALRAHREGHPRTHELWQSAWDACRRAAHSAPEDPVPWVCLLALAPLDLGQRWEEHRVAPPEPMLPHGPWGLLAEADKRDPSNREAYHRMLQFMYVRRAGGRLSEAVNFAHWAVASAEPGSPLHVLPLYVRVERYRREERRETALDLHWVAEDATREAVQALHHWFTYADPAESSLLDLNHLAHGLWGALQFADAARVFEAIGPYCTPPPWVYRTRDPADPGLATELFVQARARSMTAARGPGRG